MKIKFLLPNSFSDDLLDDEHRLNNNIFTQLLKFEDFNAILWNISIFNTFHKYSSCSKNELEAYFSEMNLITVQLKII